MRYVFVCLQMDPALFRWYATDMSHQERFRLTPRTVIVVIASSEEVMLEAVEREHPDLIVAPMLIKVIPASIWQHNTCIIVHPGIKGDRGPSSLDWAILNG